MSRMRTIALLGAILGPLAGGAAQAQSALVAQGKAAFELHCAACHARGRGDEGRAMPSGTEALHFKYRNGEKPATLEDRTDLPYEVLSVFVRQGTASMPGFRKTEVGDEDVKAIAAYLAAASRRGAR